MDETVSETIKRVKTMSSSSSSSSSTSAEKLKVLAQRTDHLLYNCHALNSATIQLNQYRHKMVLKTDGKVIEMEKGLSELEQIGKEFAEVGPLMEKELEDTLAWLFRKIGWQPKKEPKNVGYAGYEDMLLRYRDLKKELDRMQLMNNQTSNARNQVFLEKRNLRQMNEKMEEIRHRFMLLSVSRQITSRTLNDNDPLATLFFLPLVLPGIIYHADTSESYASSLLRILKRILAVAEAVQYERSPLNDPVVTNSNVLEYPPQYAVPALYAPIQYAEGNGEVLAPEERIVPIARDSAHTLIATENGEVFAPEEKIPPIARDSAHTLVASENGEVTATTEMNMPIAKDSVTTLASNESPKPLLPGQKIQGANVKTSPNKSQRTG
ncbi:Protein CBG21342 [Caenorhabditis briggsae]|uniref:Uncharacterized protein n=2 Tax=Caenorhabditis briggsae TaxID=6238 RepID=A0AAE9DW46_CAEBR|nr:Protein CBG21342 [Caenorhabditis briggsae]ULU12043.1 hypothetical protein L3Y34_015414 [Caenorhabditis briggsae]UMM12994.1 hypothetical protein L5515_001491 [Caenorhabditis briggsae]CAP38179.1 Protein CBG21342 [Caenorhabditis briggsae]